MKTATMLPLATVATQTDPWSDDCRLSLYGDDYDDIRDDARSEHIYYLHEECPPNDSVSFYDCLQSGGSETDDDGYDVIVDDNSDDENTDVFQCTDNKKQAKQFPAIGSSFHANNGNRTATLSAVGVFPHMLTTCSDVEPPPSSCPAGTCQQPIVECDNFVGASFANKCNNHQSVIRLGVESCRARRAQLIERFDNASPSGCCADASRRAYRGRVVPMMGTRLRSFRRQSATGVVAAEEDKLQTTAVGHGAAMMATSGSECEQCTSPTGVSPSRRTRSWSSSDDDGYERLIGASTDDRSASDASSGSIPGTSPAVGPRNRLRSTIETVGCDAVDARLEAEMRRAPNNGDESAATAQKNEDSVARKFIYEHYADVMYTNEANLAHTIMVQQRLFQQLLADRSITSTDRCDELLPASCFAAGGDGSQWRRRVRSKLDVDGQTRDAERNNRDNAGSSCSSKWVVRRRKDGSRYVTRSRPDDNETKAESRWRQQFTVDGQRDETKRDAKKHASKQRKVSSSGRNLVGSSRDDRVAVDGHQQRVCGAETLLKTTNKTGQHPPILAVVTI